MERIFFKKDFLVRENDLRILHQLVIYEPSPSEEGDSFCAVILTPIFKKEKKIIGIDESQAKILAVEFVKNMLSGKEIEDKNGRLLSLDNILPNN